MNEKEKILVLDDQKAILRRIKNILGAEYDLTLTNNIEDALEAVKSNYYVLAIIDWNLKAGRDGIDVLIEMQKSIVELNAIILTGHDKGTIASAGYEVGAGFVTKYPAKDLEGKLKNAVSKWKKKETNSVKVFLSYARADFEIVSKLREKLLVEGFNKIWLDKEEVYVGEVDHQIRTVIESSDFILFCLTPNFNRIGYVTRELKWALRKQEEFPEGVGYIIPVRLVDCEIPASIKDFNCVDLFEDGGFKKLVKMLQTKNK